MTTGNAIVELSFVLTIVPNLSIAPSSRRLYHQNYHDIIIKSAALRSGNLRVGSPLTCFRKERYRVSYFDLYGILCLLLLLGVCSVGLIQALGTSKIVQKAFYAAGSMGSMVCALNQLDPFSNGHIAEFVVCSTLAAGFGYRWLHEYQAAARKLELATGALCVVVFSLALAGQQQWWWISMAYWAYAGFCGVKAVHTLRSAQHQVLGAVAGRQVAICRSDRALPSDWRH